MIDHRGLTRVDRTLSAFEDCTIRRVQTIEQTSKKWKLIQAIGVAGIILGACLFFGAMIPETPGWRMVLAYAGIGVGVLSFPVYLVGRIGGWWYHG